MARSLCRECLEQHGLTVLAPDGADRELVHRVIHDESGKGLVQPSSLTG